MNNLKHITLDIETLSRTTTAPIVQIAAVEFDIEGNVIDEFHDRITPESLNQYGFEAGFDCVYWWMTDPTQVARNSVFSTDPQYKKQINIKAALHNFRNWVVTKSPSDCLFWSHSKFDPPILDYNFAKVYGNSSQNPICYRNYLDIRTLQFVTGLPRPIDGDTLHDAVSDCKVQAKWIANMLKLYDISNLNPSKVDGRLMKTI